MVRSFTYDSLKRLLTAANPEAGTITCTYDDNGNVKTKIDALRTVTMVSDKIDRLIQKNWSDGTPAVTWSYPAGSERSRARGARRSEPLTARTAA